MARTAVAIPLPAPGAVVSRGDRHAHSRHCERLLICGICDGSTFTSNAPVPRNNRGFPGERTCTLLAPDVVDLVCASAHAAQNVVRAGYTGRLPHSCGRSDDAPDTRFDSR